MTNEITVTYERKFSDGNYGSEGLSFSMSVSTDQGSDSDGFPRMAKALRTAVLEQLSQSEAPRVARAAAEELNPRPRVTAPAGRNFEPDESPF